MANPLFSQIYAVGDSLSDSGGIYQLSSQAITLAAAAGINVEGLQPIPISPPYAGKFSNGPVLPEITAQLLGANLVNFSFGGAQALGTLTLEQAAGAAIPDDVKAEIAALPAAEQAPIEAVLDKNINLSGQLADLVAETSAHRPPANSALFSMIGLNDLQSLIGTFDLNDPLALIGKAAETAVGIVQANYGAAQTAFGQGIGTVVLETLPSPSFFPIGSKLSPTLQAIGDTAVDAVNVGLKADAFVLRLEGHDARVVDLARMADEIGADPATFGFEKFDQPALLGDGITFSLNPDAPPPDETAFIDPLHPTTKLHGEFAAFTAASLTDHTDFRGGGNDFIVGRPGDDLVLAGGGNDRVSLSGGNDIAFAGLGDDVVNGGAGNDIIAGGSGNDRLSGGDGSDVIAGGAGNNILFGDAGDDVFLYTQPQLLGQSGGASNRFDGGTGFDTLAVRLDPATSALEQANVAAHFVAGQPFAFSTVDLQITNVERIVFAAQANFSDVPPPSGELGAQLQKAELFGLA